jgi:hypothetical protein
MHKIFIPIIFTESLFFPSLPITQFITDNSLFFCGDGLFSKSFVNLTRWNKKRTKKKEKPTPQVRITSLSPPKNCHHRWHRYRVKRWFSIQKYIFSIGIKRKRRRWVKRDREKGKPKMKKKKVDCERLIDRHYDEYYT